MIANVYRGLMGLVLVVALAAGLPGTARAQDAEAPVWIQIESYADLATAERRVRAYARLLDNVAGFQAAGGFYSIAIGPLPRAEAAPLLAELRGSGQIPGDSFLQDAAEYTAQFFPVGADAGLVDAAEAETAEAPLVDEAAVEAPAETAAEDTAPEAPAPEDTAAADTAAADTAPEAETAEAEADATPEPTGPVDTPDATGPEITEAETFPAEDPAAAPDAAATEAATIAAAEIAADLGAQDAPQPEPEETEAEARASEAELTREERDALQIALQFFGFYTSRIDGAFGPGTRNAMAAWQESRGFEATGVLTTRQRAQLLDERAAELARFGFETVRDEEAGIEIDLPLSMVRFSAYNFPFAQYERAEGSDLRIFLISQAGDRSTLFGLYEIMQTLRIVPPEGQRERRGDSFLLTGQSAALRSHTEARLVGGAVKGFTLVWGPSMDDDIPFILARMQDSFAPFTGALDPAFVPESATEDIDLVSGFEVRRPEVVRSGFYIDPAGTVLTTLEAVTGSTGSCERILIDNAYPARVAFRDAALGLAVLTPQQTLAPLDHARLSPAPARLRGDVAVAGFPFDGALATASTGFGTLAALEGVNGETTMQRLDIDTADSEAGAPVLDISGAVVGMVLPGIVGNRALPDEVTMALRIDAILPALEAGGIAPVLSDPADLGALNRETLSRLGADIAVRVSCWN